MSLLGACRAVLSTSHGKIRKSENTFTISIKAPFSIPGKPREGGSKNEGQLLKVFLEQKAQDTSTTLRRRQQPIHETSCRNTLTAVQCTVGALVPSGIQQTSVFDFDMQILSANVFLWELADESLRPQLVNEF